jgi:DMSO/TMAO reductase YedYZ molybdopterin-dependent catalytic subunit
LIRITRVLPFAAAAILFTLVQMGLPAYSRLLAQTSAAGRLAVTGDVEHPLSLSIDDLRHLPRTTLKVTNPHEGKEETYEGVALGELLKRAGVPQGSNLRGAAMATYVLAEAADGYRVTFSLAELDSDFQDSGVIVADEMNGQPMGDKVGPLRLVVPHDKRPARWVRMLQAIKVVTVPK